MSICLLSLLAGALLCFWTPVVQFALGLSVTAMAGACLALALGSPGWPVLGWSVAVFACAQVGYGMGLAAILLYRARGAGTAGGTRLSRLSEPFWK